MTSARLIQIVFWAGILVGSGLAGCTPERSDIPDATARPAGLSKAQILQLQIGSLRDPTQLPGLVVAWAEGYQEPTLAAMGYADTAQKIPLDPETPFFIGSISKNLFATILLQLVDDGVLLLDDPLSSYVKWPRGDEITLRMLLNHTSGIPDYFGSLSLLESEDGVPDFFSEARTPADIIRLLPKREPTFDPGSEQSYSNTNGLLVGQIIETVTGESLGTALATRIAVPLGLENTYLFDESTLDQPRARGYCGNPGWITERGQIIDCSFADEALIDSADGSVVSSAGDLLRYHQALRGGELLSAASWDAMRTVEPGLDNGLGYLIMTGPMGDHQGNVGRAMGHLAASIYYLDRDVFVVMLLNRGDAQLPLLPLLEQRWGPA